MALSPSSAVAASISPAAAASGSPTVYPLTSASNAHGPMVHADTNLARYYTSVSFEQLDTSGVLTALFGRALLSTPLSPLSTDEQRLYFPFGEQSAASAQCQQQVHKQHARFTAQGMHDAALDLQLQYCLYFDRGLLELLAQHAAGAAAAHNYLLAFEPYRTSSRAQKARVRRR